MWNPTNNPIFVLTIIGIFLVSVIDAGEALQCYRCQSPGARVPDTGMPTLLGGATDCPKKLNDSYLVKCEMASARCAKFQETKATKKNHPQESNAASFKPEGNSANDLNSILDGHTTEFRGCVDSTFCASTTTLGMTEDNTSINNKCTTCNINKCNHAPTNAPSALASSFTFLTIAIIKIL